MSQVFARIRQLLRGETLEAIKSIVDKFVSSIVVNPDGVIVCFNFFPDFTIRPESRAEKDRPASEHVANAQEQSISHHQTNPKMADENGGAGGS